MARISCKRTFQKLLKVKKKTIIIKYYIISEITDFHRKSMDWFLYNWDLCHERVNEFNDTGNNALCKKKKKKKKKFG